MGAYPKGYKKEDFLEFLLKNNVSENIVEKFKLLPETIISKGFVYKLNILSTWYSVGNTFFNFELNYYSEEQIEFLFGYKIFNDVGKSIDYLLCELYNGNFIEKREI